MRTCDDCGEEFIDGECNCGDTCPVCKIPVIECECLGVDVFSDGFDSEEPAEYDRRKVEGNPNDD